MKKYLLLLNFVLVTSFAQNAPQKCAVVEYKTFNNTNNPNTISSTLFINGSATIYLPKYSTKVYKDEKSNSEPKNTVADWFYIKFDHSKKEALLFDGFGANKFLIEDIYKEFNWDVSSEVKNIAGYNCIKASTEFRGRVWTVWFTPDISLPYGSWKLHGLPGLILEAYENTNMFTIKVDKIDYKKAEIFDKDFNALVVTKNKKPLAIKDFFDEQIEFFRNAELKYNQEHPGSDVSYPIIRGSYELKYEWEE